MSRHTFTEVPHEPKPSGSFERSSDEDFEEGLAPVHTYSRRDLARLFEIPDSLVDALERSDLITGAEPEGHTVYSVSDMLVLRAAASLKATKVPLKLIPPAVGQLRRALPRSALLSTMALAAEEESRAIAGHSEDESSFFEPRAPLPSYAEAQEHYERALAVEETDVSEARAAYLHALSIHSEHIDARISLGRLLHAGGDLGEAEKVYRQAKRSSAHLSFNLGVLLEDLERKEEAAAAYRDALAQDPHFYDAHFNLARLYEQADRPREALHHWLTYRRRAPNEESG